MQPSPCWLEWHCGYVPATTQADQAMTVLDTLAPTQGRIAEGRASDLWWTLLRLGDRIVPLAAPAVWIVSAVLVTAAFRLAGGADGVFLAMGGTAALVLPVAGMISGRAGLALADICAAGLIVGLAAAGLGPAAVFMGHALWAAVRVSAGGQAPARSFVANWGVFFASLALFAGLSG